MEPGTITTESKILKCSNQSEFLDQWYFDEDDWIYKASCDGELLHSHNGEPAMVEFIFGRTYWLFHGMNHRIDGPFFECNGPFKDNKEYAIFGHEISTTDSLTEKEKEVLRNTEKWFERLELSCHDVRSFDEWEDILSLLKTQTLIYEKNGHLYKQDVSSPPQSEIGLGSAAVMAALAAFGTTLLKKRKVEQKDEYQELHR